MSQLRLCLIAVAALMVHPSAAPAQTLEKLESRLVVLSIGVSEHQAGGQGGLANLKHAAKDARDLAQALQGQHGKLYTHVAARTLTDAQATRQNIEEALDWLSRQVTG